MDLALTNHAPPSIEQRRAEHGRSPPFALPAVHFAAALPLFALGSLGLVYIAPELCRGWFFTPQVVAVVHLFVLGWIMLSVFGALCQFLPVAVGQPLRFARLVPVSFTAHVLGLALFVAGLWFGSRHLLFGGASLVTFAFFTFGTNLAASLVKARPKPLLKKGAVTFWALTFATVFLFVTPSFGLFLSANLTGHAVVQDRFTMIAVHAHLGLVGIILLVIVGVAQRLLPMFLLSHGVGEMLARVAVVLLATGACLLAIFHTQPAFHVAALLCVLFGVVAFLVQAARFFAHRKRRAFDAGVGIFGVGLLGIVGALLLAPWVFVQGRADAPLLSVYFIVLIGALSLFVVGHYYKIVPFLVWYHRFGPLIGKQKVPTVGALWSGRSALVVGGLLGAGWLGLSASVYFGQETLARLFASLYAGGALLHCFNISRVFTRRPS